MNTGKLVEWGGIILVALLLWRWLSGALSSGLDQPLQQTWQPNIYPYGLGRGVVVYTPGIVGPRYNPGTWTSKNGPRGHRGH